MIDVATHAMDYVDAATTGIFSPHILPIEDLRKMLSHIEETLSSTMHLTVSSEDTFHFYRHLHTQILIPHNIHNRYFGIMYDETKAVEISEEQFNTCQKANSFAV